MLTVKINCQNCGHEFEFSPQDYTLKGLSYIPKHCPRCCDERQGLKKVVLSRKLLKEWQGVYIETLPVDGKERNDENSIYKCYYFGGRNTGHYGGASFTHKWLVYVHKDVTFPSIVNIRLMEKIWQKNNEQNNEQTRNKSIEYIVIEPSELQTPTWYLYCLRDYYKTTLKGFGKDRNLTQHIEPLDGDSFTVEEVIRTSSGARSGRFGNTRRWVVADCVCKVVSEGVA